MDSECALLPHRFARWFDSRGWRPHPHQLAMLKAARDRRSTLLIAPTGGGKTLAGFLPSLVALDEQPREGLHTLYISPLKALAVDIHRNLVQPVEEMGLTLTLETRTGDTPQAKRQRQRIKPPNLLMTTPESLALMLSFPDAEAIFSRLETVIVDELHAIEPNKRGDLLALGLARLSSLAPTARRVGLSATVGDERRLIAWLSPTGSAESAPVTLVRGPEGALPELSILLPEAVLPWAGHMGMHAVPEIYQAVKNTRTALVFVNTRAQAELVLNGGNELIGAQVAGGERSEGFLHATHALRMQRDGAHDRRRTLAAATAAQASHMRRSPQIASRRWRVRYGSGTR